PQSADQRARHDHARLRRRRGAGRRLASWAPEAETVTLPTLADCHGTLRWLTAEDGIRLRVVSFPAKGPERGPLLFLNGMSEFVEKHLETVADLQARGFAVTT